MTTPNAKQTVSSSPMVAVLYGVPKTGKTTDILYSLPRSFFFARPPALKPSIKVVGYEPPPNQIWYTNRIQEMTKYLPKLGSEFDSVAVDDFSVQAEETYNAIKAAYKGSNNYAPWGFLRQEVIDFINAARDCGKHVIINTHEGPPKTKNGAVIRGGPQLPTDLPEKLPALADTVLRAYPDPNRLGPWKMVYRCTETDPNYISGDRNGVTPDMAPMNLGEIMRAAGYKLRRAPGLEWLDEVAELIAGYLLNATSQQQPEVMAAAADYMRTRGVTNDLHMRWAMRDGLDRAMLRKARSNILSAFLAPPSPY